MHNPESVLFAISPIDGRYHTQTAVLGTYFSEFGLIHYRLQIEIEYFVALVQKAALPALARFSPENINYIRSLYTNFCADDALAIKQIEKQTNHDIKALEYFIKQKFEENGLARYAEFIHFGLTSQDINNTAIPLSLKTALEQIFWPGLDRLLAQLNILAHDWKHISMLAHTHGQPASPTTAGKEIMVFVTRLSHQIIAAKQIPLKAKFGGATGNMNAHFVAYPNTDWFGFANDFVSQLGLERSHNTTQIEHYDFLAALFHNFQRLNTILIDMCRDLWQYISMNYFKQKIMPGEIGSSAMPHKVNPIDFENAEGNLNLANATFSFLAAKLPISRLQRDLTDSTVLRNLGVPFAHTLIALHSIQKGLNKLEINGEMMRAELDKNWAVVAEALQTILRRENFPKPYEALKALTRTGGTPITQTIIHEFIHNLDIADHIKTEMLAISPFNYIGKLEF